MLQRCVALKIVVANRSMYITFRLAKHQLSTCITLFVHFFKVERPNFTFYGGREHNAMTFFSFFSKLRYSPLECNTRKIRPDFDTLNEME